VVSRQEVCVTQPVPGRSVVSPQTFTLPDYAKRLVVQAELVADGDPSGGFGLPGTWRTPSLVRVASRDHPEKPARRCASERLDEPVWASEAGQSLDVVLGHVLTSTEEWVPRRAVIS
jgi:hypothetical protein